MPKFDNRTPAAGIIAATPLPPSVSSSKKSSPKHQLNVAVPKRMSVAYLQHPVSYVTATAGYPQYASQQQLLVPRHNYQQLMWHARSMESGLGKYC